MSFHEGLGGRAPLAGRGRAVRLALRARTGSPARGQGTPRTGPGPNVFAGEGAWLQGAPRTGGEPERVRGGGVVAAGNPARAGNPVHGQARWGRGPQRRAAFSSPSWIAGRFECFLWMRHLPKVGE